MSKKCSIWVDGDRHVGIITIEETIRLFKHVATSLSIQVTHFEKREDVLDLLSEC